MNPLDSERGIKNNYNRPLKIYKNNFFFIFFALSLIIILGFFFYKQKIMINSLNSYTAVNHIVINAKKIKVEVADNYAEHVKGLSGRLVLESDSGMLFKFRNKRIRKIWMKNMHFPIDIIWIENKKIIKINRSCEPEGDVPRRIYNSIFPVDKILEVNAGFSDKFAIKEGDLVMFN